MCFFSQPISAAACPSIYDEKGQNNEQRPGDKIEYRSYISFSSTSSRRLAHLHFHRQVLVLAGNTAQQSGKVDVYAGSSMQMLH